MIVLIIFFNAFPQKYDDKVFTMQRLTHQRNNSMKNWINLEVIPANLQKYELDVGPTLFSIRPNS